MKKVLSVAMASAMVLGMGANAFAIQYSTSSNDTAKWPTDFKFEGPMFVTNKDGDIVKSAITDLSGKNRISFDAGDVIWMPLHADNQRVYGVEGNKASTSTVDAAVEYLNPVGVAAVAGNGDVVVDLGSGDIAPFVYRDSVKKIEYSYGKAAFTVTAAEKADGWRTANITSANLVALDGSRYVNVDTKKLTDYQTTVTGKGTNSTDHEVAIDTITATLNGGKTVSTIEANTTATVTYAGVTIATNVPVYDPQGTAATDRTFKFDLDSSMLQKIMDKVNPANKYNPNIREVGAKVTVTTTTSTAGTETSGKNAAAVVYATDYNVVTTTGGAWNSNVYVKVNLAKVTGTDVNLGIITGVNDNGTTTPNAVYADDSNYTDNIDKNWSINLIEKSTGVAELIEKAELYKADEVDYLSYKDHTTEIMPNAVYVKITLKKEWKTVSTETLKYYVYVADNKNNANKTNEVWVSGTYANSNVRYVNFDWTNDASKAGLWKVRADENGIAVFDFADKAFFSVKMYAGESMYLDLATAYDKVIAGEMDAEADSFYKFDNTNANFARVGELIIASDDDTLVPYEIDADGNFVAVDAEYVKNYAVAHTNTKVNGFVFNTKQLGNYVLSTEELGEEEVPADDVEEEPADDVEEPAEVVVPETKPNPETGAEDFVGLAVSLAVVSVAAAGALALKK